jgi:transposase
MRAAELFRKGRQPADVARELAVSIQTASTWRKAWAEGGKAALRGAGRAGRMPKLTEAQLKAVDAVLRKGAKASSYPSELWTLPRVAEVIAKSTGVTYHPGHVWRILRQMGWSRQRPARRAAERDQRAIDTWVKQRWPVVKKTPDGGRL